MSFSKMKKLEDDLLSVYDDSDNGMVNIYNKTIKESTYADVHYPWAKIVDFEANGLYDGFAAGNGQLKPGWLMAAHELATGSNSNVKLHLVRAYSNGFEEHKVEIVRGRATVTCVSELASVLEKHWAAKLSLTAVANFLNSIDKLIYTVELFEPKTNPLHSN